jgi:hypothetical protein
MTNPTKTFRSPIGKETSYSNVQLSDDTESTLELFTCEDGSYSIEWDIPELEETEHIGIFVEEGTKTICDYDGVFEVPKEVIEFLREQGFNVEYFTN